MEIDQLKSKKKQLLKYLKEFFRRVEELSDSKKKKLLRIVDKLVNVDYTM